jgi:alcohol dehydrogenase class IV
MEGFEYNSNRVRTVFGSSTIQQLPTELKRLDLSRPFLLSTPRGVESTRKLEAICADSSYTPAGAYNNATMHTPIHITEEAVALAKKSEADCVVSIGGGSTVGLGKAICLRLSLPHICLPTTYAGSEMTPILGETVNGQKSTRSDPKIVPDIVIYDVDLSMSLPPSTSAVSGINAMAHAGK